MSDFRSVNLLFSSGLGAISDDPIRMVAINVLSIIVLFTILFIWKYVFPRKNINLFFLLILLSVLPVISIFRNGSYESGGFFEHIKFVVPFYRSLSEGNFLPQWADIACATYGCPTYMFLYIFPYYLVSFFHLFGLSFIDSTKIVIASSYIFSGISMYIFVNRLFGSRSAFVSSIFYLFSPYHLVDMHFRVSVAQLITYPLIPLAFLFTYNITQTTKLKWFFLLSITICLLIITHHVITFTIFPFLMIYGLLINKVALKKIFFYFSSIILGILLASFYWVPLILESKYIYYTDNPPLTFPLLHEFIYSPWMFGFLFQGHYGEYSYIIGYFHWIIIFISIMLVIASCINPVQRTLNGLLKQYVNIKLNSDEKMLSVFLVVSFFIVFIIMQQFSRSLWNNIPFMKNFQYSFRLLIHASFFTSILAGLISLKIKNETVLKIVCLLVILTTILNWGHRKMLPWVNDSTFISGLLHSEVFELDPTMPRWVDIKSNDIRIPPVNHIELISGQARIKEIFRNSTKHEYIISTKSLSSIKENTFYFPGWKVFANNIEIPINYENKKHPGIITFNLGKGLHKIEVKFTQTRITTFARLLSLLAIILSPCLFILFKLRRKANNIIIKAVKKKNI